MEYLSRILTKLSELQQFQFHPRCKKMRTFADDLILCCKGDFASICLLLEAFKLFSESYGLKANVSKSAMFTCGIDPVEKQRAAAVSGFAQHGLPFKYLGIPIRSRRVSGSQCEILIEKMMQDQGLELHKSLIHNQCSTY